MSRGQDHALIDLSGRTFGRIAVLSRSGSASNRSAMWECRCECGKVWRVGGRELRDGITVSCGCYRAEILETVHTKHGDAKRSHAAPEYLAWRAMIRRCTDTAHENYASYGGRGIAVCQAWLESYPAFLECMGRRPTPKHTLERIDNEGGYHPQNCKWATRAEQAINRRPVRAVRRSDGTVFRSQKEAAEAIGIHPTGISAALRGVQPTAGGYGWAFPLAMQATGAK